MASSWQTLMSFRRDPQVAARKGIDKALVKRVIGYARPYRKQLTGFLLTVVIAAIVGAIPPLLFRELIDRGLPSGDRPGNLGIITWLTIGAVAVAISSAVLSLVQRYFSARIGEGLIFDLRVALFDHVQRLPLSFFTRTQTGALQSRLNNDVIGAQQAVTNTLGTVVSNVITLAVTLTVMLGLEWRLTLLTLLVLPFFILPARRIGTKLQTATREQMNLNASMNTTIAERFNVAGAMVVKLFGRYDAERQGFADRAGKVRDIGISLAMYMRTLFVALGFVAAVGAAIVYYVGGRLAISGAISAGTVGAFVLYVAELYTPLTQLTNARVDVLTTLVSFERVFEVLDFPPAISDRPDARRLEKTKGAVAFDHVWFRHLPASATSLASLEDTQISRDLESEWILSDINFSIAPGETVALVGPSGAGKTTTALLIPRIYDVTKGGVTIDGTNIHEYTADSLRHNIGMVMQDAHLFHETIRENLLYAQPEANDAQLLDACRRARIYDLVKAMPLGLDTVVGERGYRLSGGEKQRLAIARMLLKDPAIIILDEATSHLDSESESAIQAALEEALEDRTALVIAHRLSTIIGADRIVVLNDGVIAEEGTHSSLLSAGGLYADLYRTQLQRSELTG